MPRKVIAEFRVEHLQVLDKDGNCDDKLLPKEINEKMCKNMYEAMLLTRIADKIALKLQREGRMYTYASTLGQEAQVGAGFAMEKDDLLFPSFREHGVLFVRGVPLDIFYQYWMGDERGSKVSGNIFPMSVPVGTQTLHAVGAAYAFKYQKKKNAVVVFHGDGGTSEGDQMEAMNFAGVFKVPVVIICQNNQWAISVPREKQCAAGTLAQKSIAYGFEGLQVDGNDVFAVYLACKQALEKAREGKGPTFIEMYTYRVADHTTSDDAKRYRDPKEVEEWKNKDPIDRLRKYMKKKKWWSESYEKKINADLEKKINDAVKKSESVEPQPPTSIVDFIFEKLTPNLEEQRKEIEDLWK
jgi:pyruvate dehydrogenase E1 component alpha subunit